MMKPSRIAIIAMIAALGAAGGAFAQAPHEGLSHGGLIAPMDGGRHAEHMKALHGALNIRPDQEAAFQAFAMSMSPMQNGHMPMHDGPGHGGEMDY